MDGVFKVPGCRMSVASKSRAGPPPPPRVPAKSMENLSGLRNNQQVITPTFSYLFLFLLISFGV